MQKNKFSRNGIPFSTSGTPKKNDKKNMLSLFKWIIICFVLFCGFLVLESGLFVNSSRQNKDLILLQQTTTPNAQEVNRATEPNTTNVQIGQLQSQEVIEYDADHAPATTIILGADDPNTEDPQTGYKYQMELSPLGASIRKVTFSNGDGKGFDDRDYKNPKPLVLLQSANQANGSEILSLANTGFQNRDLINQGRKLPLEYLRWQSLGKETSTDNSSQSASYEAIIKIRDTNEPVFRITKSYTIRQADYMLDCDITIENLSETAQSVRFNLAGPTGLSREGFRTDMRKVIGGFENADGITREKFEKKDILNSTDGANITKGGANFLWAASVNKYFAAIVIPQSEQDKQYCDWLAGKTALLYNPDGDAKANTGDETFGIDFNIALTELAAVGRTGSSKTYNFQVYLGPKDRDLFNKNEQYKALGFIQTIDFLSCCCPEGIVYPLAFGILALMKWMFAFIPNYGIVIIILVFFVRLILHPVTKKSQISMSKMSKLAPKAEEIKKKYGNNKVEMNRQMMALYKEQGASPLMGFLPMFIQMPILIALWSAIYTSIDLRGAGFLPFWITDLSAPDALIRFKAITLPLFGELDSFNLLPILMGVAMYLQQSLMPTQSSTNPQMAQQQKMMKIMFPIMLPLILYKGPSGVNLYFMSSTFAGVIEQRVIRKHIREKEEEESKGLVNVTSKTGGKVKKKKPKPFFKT